MGRGLWWWFWGGGGGEGGRSLGGIVGRLGGQWGFPEVGRRQVCGEGLAVEEVGGCLEERQCGQRGERETSILWRQD